MDEPLTCRICYEEGGDLIRPCACKGTAGNIHVHCLKHWVKESGKNTCEICKTEYAQHDVLSCNMDRYCNALWTFRSRSRIEKGLTRLHRWLLWLAFVNSLGLTWTYGCLHFLSRH